jgi:ubiquinone/menaquinone biosynthesis C-methylase UbiE
MSTLENVDAEYCGICEFRGEFHDFAGRERVHCPGCGSLERHRKQYLYLRSNTDIFSPNNHVRLLHIAPEPCFAQLFRSCDNIFYVSSDLNPRNRGASPTNPITPADLTALPFTDEVFDVVICSHVLEHIPFDDDAMDELHRVLKPNGLAILDVPLSKDDTTYEDWSLTTPQQRTAAFGQYDHVRLYGQDFFTKLAHAGIEAQELDDFWPSHQDGDQRLGAWGIVVGRWSTPTPASERPPHNRPIERPTLMTSPTESPAKPDEALGPKHDSELGYWLGRFEAENQRFHNGWYRDLMVGVAGAEDESDFEGKIVADFGCGPRGSLAWCKGASMRFGIDVLADIYAEHFENALREHETIYVRSTESYIPMPSDSVDVLITINSLVHVDNLAEMSAELVRILKPGGLFLGSFNLEEPANEAEPQCLNEAILTDVLFRHLEVESVRITDQHEGYANRYEPFLSGMELTYSKGEEGILWMRGTKPS